MRGRLHHPPPAVDGPGDVRDHRARLPDLLRDAGRRPGPPDRGPKPVRRRRSRRSGTSSASTGPLPVRYVHHDEEALHHRDLVSYSNQGQSVVPEIVAATAGDALARLRRGHDLGGGGDHDGRGRGGAQGHAVRPVAHDPRADRDLDAGVLAGRGREPAHPAPVPRLVPLQLGAAASATRRSRRIRSCGSRASSSRGSRCRCSTSASTRGCCARACSRCRTRTTCAPRGPRASPSGGCSCATPCARR